MKAAGVRQDTAARVLRRADAGEEMVVSGVLVDALHTHPICQWLIEDDDARPFVLLEYFPIIVGHVLTYGHVEIVDGSTGPLAVTGWLPPDAPPEPEDHPRRVAAATGDWADRFITLHTARARARANGTYRLLFHATRTDAQHRGLGTALLGHQLDRLDRLRQLASVNAAGERAVDFYGRFRFTAHTLPVTLTPHASQAITPLHRAPDLIVARRSRESRR